MTLLELCEPLFQYICMLNRIARNPGGENVEYAPLRAQIESMFENMAAQSESEERLASQYNKMQVPLIFFVDSMLAESRLRLAPEWNKHRLAYERNELAGDEKFFDLLDETLQESGSEATERLEVYYACLGLGFQGWYAGQPEYLRKKMLLIAQRIPHLVDSAQTARLFPEAYEHTDARDLVEPPGLKMVTMGIAFAGLCLVVLTVNFSLFRTASTGLSDALRVILSQDLTQTK